MEVSGNKEEEKKDLEQQFILRLPPVYATKLREVLATKPKKIKKLLKLNLNFEHNVHKVYIGKKVLQGKLKNLPTLIDSNKTYDNVNIYKTADISQILVCSEKSNNKDEAAVDVDNIDLNHGITEPMKNVKKKRFRRTWLNQDQVLEIENVERELLYLFRMDMEAISLKFEVLYENEKTDSYKKEIILFGNLSSDSEVTDE